MPAVAEASEGARRALRLLALVAGVAAGRDVPGRARAVGVDRCAAARPLAAAVVVADLLVVAVAALGPWRTHPLGPPLAIVVVTLATLILDVLTGSNLELNGLLGYDAIVAGRFTGYGNLSFGLLSVSALLVTAAVATLVGRRARPERARRATWGTVVASGCVTVAIIGAPGLGRDFGGVLAALPGFLLLAHAADPRPGHRRPARADPGAAVVAVGTVAYLDWLRPAGERTHLGRFVEQVLTGEAWTVVSRKGAGQPRHPARQPAGLDAAGGARRRGVAGPARRPAAVAAQRRTAPSSARPDCRCGNACVVRAALLAGR